MELSDSELLRRYLDERGEDALAAIVRRYLDLVYSASLRQVGGDAHFAEDVVQQVFVDFVRKAAALRNRASLGGWFYTSAHFAAAKLVRGERRRKARDLEAIIMDEVESGSAQSFRWEQLRPVLDHAMHDLGERDRETVLLRYFERLPLAEVGNRLGISENAASKTVERALDRLRDCLVRRGITSTASALAIALADNAVASAPAGLANSVALSLGRGAALATGATITTLMTKKTAIVVLAVLLLLATSVATYKTLKVRALDAEIAALRMDNLPKLPHRPKPVVGMSVAPASATSQRPPAPAETAAPPVGSVEPIRNAGRATPAAAYVTFYWAMEQGDVQLLADDIVHDDDGNAIFQKAFDELRPEARAFYGTPDIMVAAVGSYMNRGAVTRLEILGEKPSGDDAVMISYRRGEDPAVRYIPLVRGDDGWKVVGRGSIFMDRGRIEAFFKAAEELPTAIRNGSEASRKIKMPPRH